MIFGDTKRKKFTLFATRITFFGTIGILFLFLVLDKRLPATVFCIVAFLCISAAAIIVNKQSRKRALHFLVLTKDLTKKEFFASMIIFLFCAIGLIQVASKPFHVVFFGGLFIIFTFALVVSNIKRFICKRRIPRILKQLETTSSLKNYLRIISSLLIIDDFENAAIYADKALGSFPDNVEIIVWRATIHRYAEEYEKAAILTKKAYEIAPRNSLVRSEIRSLKSLGIKVITT